MSCDAVLYFATPADLAAAQVSVAGRPVAFRAIMAAVRAGAASVGVPAVLRGTGVEIAVAATPSARRGVVWLDAGATASERPVLLIPAGTVLTAATVRLLTTPGAPAVVLDPDAPDAPAALVGPHVVRTLWNQIAAGEPVGALLARELKGNPPALRADAVFARVATGGDAARAETALLRSLGSPIDTRLDTVVHRTLSRPLTRLAVRAGVPPNPITVASMVVGLLAAWCVAWATPAGALLGLCVYATAVVLDHVDGEVARVTFAESAAGEWLDVIGDTIVHAVLVLAMGLATQRVAGTGAVAGLVAAAGIVASAWSAKTSPSASGRLGGMLAALGTRDGYYVMLLLYVATITLLPSVLPALMLIVAVGSHAYWLVRLASRAGRRVTP